jgi:hypothetical protein
MTNDVRRNFYRQVWHVLSNDETMQIMTYIEVYMILMVAMYISYHGIICFRCNARVLT